MAKTIDLSPGPAPTKTALPSMPPPATLPPGVSSGVPPMPIGRVVSTINPQRLTEFERKELNKIGWKPGQAVPSNMAQILAGVEASSMQQANAAALVPPIDPSTPPVTPTILDSSKLSPEQQENIRLQIAAALAENTAAASVLPANMPGFEKTEVLNIPATPVARPAPAFDPRILNKAATLTPLDTAAPEAAAAAATEAAVAEPADADADDDNDIRTNCPHCNWDLSSEDIPPPSMHDRIAFLQSVLGQKPFERDCKLMGGRVTVTFRTLTTSELDAAFKHAFTEREQGLFKNDIDYFERVTRLRLFLQLQRVRSDSFDHEMPDGLSPATNPNATAYWKFSPTETAPPLALIEKWLLANVLKTETLMRLVYQQSTQFNRLCAKLEAMVEDADFWKATGSQP